MMVENRCYDSDCNDENCRNPEHYNYICLDPNCDEIHCENPEHYNKQLLRDYQVKTDFSVHDHSEKIDYDEDVDLKICGCPDCADDDDHDHDHDHEHEHHHNHDHEEDVCTDDDCGCHDHDHEHEHHDHEHEHNHDHEEDVCTDDDCGCHDHDHEHHHHEHEGDVCTDDDCGCHDHDHDGDISLCGCPDCADDDDDDGELLAEGKPLLSNRPIQIIVASGILFVLGHVFEWLSFSPTVVTITYMVGAVIAGYEIAISAYKSLVKRHTVGPAMLLTIACIASFIIGHPEEGAAVTFLY